MLNNFESNNAGTKYAIVNSFLQILPDLKQQFKGLQAGICKKCGETASKEKCNACKFVEKLEKARIKINS